MRISDATAHPRSDRTLPAAVLWDMDGTLLDSERLWDIAVEDLCADLGFEMTSELRESTLGNSMTDALAKIFDAAGIPVAERDHPRTERWLLDRVHELFADDLPWRPGAVAALELIAAAGIPMALVTNTVRELTEVALNTLGRDRFGATVCGDEVTRAKPDPEPYVRAATLLGVDPNACRAVEDSPAGTASAVAAGCHVLTVASASPIPGGPRRTARPTLVGLTLDDLATPQAFRSA